VVLGDKCIDSPGTNSGMAKIILADNASFCGNGGGIYNRSLSLRHMKDNNIPYNAYFKGIENGYDAYSGYCLAYDIQIPTTEKDKSKSKFRIDRFGTFAFKNVYDLLTTNGFKRVGYNSGLLKEFDDTTVYDMFINNEFDRLVKYYSLSFKLIETN
jgi:hypothetical protein